MSKLRESLRQLLFGNPFTTALYSVGIVFVFLYPVMYMLNSALYISFLGGLNYILYIFYLLGILICIASNRDWAVAAALYIIAFGNLINACNRFNFSTFVGLIVYILLGTFFVWISVATKNGNDMLEVSFKQREKVTYGGNIQSGDQVAVQQPKHCPSCGNLVEEDAVFCPFCGGKYPEALLGGGRIIVEPGYSSPLGWIMHLCGSPLAMAFNILFSVSILLKIISDFSFSTIILQTLVILISVSCWMIYVGSRKGKLTTTGFSIINVVMIIEMILYMLIPVVGVFLGVLLMSAGYSETTTMGISIILVSVIGGIALFFYWNGLRKVSSSAKAIINGQPVAWSSSLFCIIINGINAFFCIIFLIAKSIFLSSFTSIIYDFCDQLRYYAGGQAIVDNLVNELNKVFFGGNTILGYLSSIVGIAVTICVIVILCKIRSSND